MIMKNLAVLFILFATINTWAQKDQQTTDGFVVTGLVKNELKFNISDLENYKTRNIEDVIITNHLGVPRKTLKNLKGILVKDVLKNMELTEESPKLFSEFYLTFVAIDNYKVVYSWNEIFNSPTGDNLYIITSKNGKKISDMEDRLLILTPTDFKTGRRHIKSLNKIIVSRAK